MEPEIGIDARGGGLVWVSINRPEKHNALARSVLDTLAAAIREAGSDAATRCLVLRGAGDKYFAAGGDLVDLSAVRSEREIDAMADAAVLALDAIRDCPVPVVAYLNGDAIGGGAELAVACDMRVFAPHARMGFLQARMGISSAWGGGPDLYALVGPSRAVRMLSRSELVDANLALQWGLADLEASDGADGELLRAFLKPVLACSRFVLEAIKAQAAAVRFGLDLTARRKIERQHLQMTWASADHWDAVERFLAKAAKP